MIFGTQVEKLEDLNKANKALLTKVMEHKEMSIVLQKKESFDEELKDEFELVNSMVDDLN